MNFFGLDIAMIGYQGTVFPVLLTVWFMSVLEKRLRKVIPNALDLILTPFLTVVISGFVALLFIGAGRALGDGILRAQHADCPCGVVRRAAVRRPLFRYRHHRHSPQFPCGRGRAARQPHIGVNFLLPIWSMANIAQGGACLACISKPATPNQSHRGAFGLFRHARHHRAALFGINLRS
ncbi:PTS system sucrose-specific EIIBC component-like [Nilaparvata lugens]|uniref:PTS system sucrose-specific EIIBC component-like n=1 Tax=Nilaparvata lugens TaxID=108931 RepID=UPI00193DCFF4|nr:PTS system sucrose-specific EIIBC component-like [Nilaparvata lugens]